jgi:cyclopropane fatty-acyl-phospholipid synthase-like methyltransferase
MTSIKDDRGYNQMFKPSEAMDIRTERRVNEILSQMSLNADIQCSILEIGSGTGELAAFMASKLNNAAQITGSDICVPFVEEAIQRHKLPNTPAWLIKPTIAIGNTLEKISFMRWLSQSLFISAQNINTK